MRYIIEVPERFPYKNELTPSPDRRAFLEYRRLRELWGWLLKRHSPSPVPQVGPRRLIITRVYAGRERRFDIGNLYVGAAIMIDHLVNMGWFKDDTEQWLCALTCRQCKSGIGRRGVEFIIEDVDGWLDSRVA